MQQPCVNLLPKNTAPQIKKIVDYKEEQKGALTSNLHYLILSQYYPGLDPDLLQGIKAPS